MVRGRGGRKEGEKRPREVSQTFRSYQQYPPNIFTLYTRARRSGAEQETRWRFYRLRRHAVHVRPLVLGPRKRKSSQMKIRCVLLYVNGEFRMHLAAVSIQDFGGPQDTRSMLARRHTNRHVVVQPLPLLCWPKRRVKSYIIDTLLALLTG